MGLLLSLGIITLDKVTIFKEAFPININEYWFIKCYILLYCLSPFINKGLKNFDKKKFSKTFACDVYNIFYYYQL